mgnify:CR=1 FL=1
MTIVYKKNSGQIRNVFEDQQKAEILFGEDVENYLLIYDLLFVDYDKSIFG